MNAPVASLPSHHVPSERSPALDGVRAVSILAVLWTHLMPFHVGGVPLNESLGMFGMALFFILSGYLITGQLLKRPPVSSFLARRLLRVVPAAWICLVVVWLFRPVDLETAFSYLFFYANLPPQRLVPPIDHFWSLCVEVQFYMLAALMLWLRVRAIWWLFPALLLTFTGMRISHEITASSVTWFRADDLLAGACLALLVNSRLWPQARKALSRPGVVPGLLLLLLAGSFISHDMLNPLSYLRPYAAAAFVGALLAQPNHRLSVGLGGPALAYIASISYALYVWHLPLAATWLGSGDLWTKYLKRPLLLLVVFGIAHVSTFQVERRFNELAKRVGAGRGQRLKEV
ncbi:Peptidoglycan/LPS O-acetylase OafA/YrhL, contains acyltransferase and SGNH-hydrolase domains [Roseateles sp. YR242]|uniref:acyltransferase family protein n=1 Tax=Roseateles sp. YR242 TaxID=1855305 RepID=UPI0008B0B9C0|nr:acyltransferase [Roseateles sp. YR242]SEK52735.1 Peptidoglycan/LPS O-acetylase OafA/YrhL, contains acyltransferase and SGNH-hydrolase domains [Roseateles sp. YR242]